MLRSTNPRVRHVIATALGCLCVLLTAQSRQAAAFDDAAAKSSAASDAAGNTAAAPNATAKQIDFSRDIRPILAEKCLHCHSGEKPEGKLRLGERTSVLGKGESGAIAVVPGQPDKSEVIRRITAADADERMPPADEKRLLPAEIASLTQWVAQGAAWSNHWSFEPLSAVTPPQVAHEAWVKNGIDRFVLSQLEQKKTTPSAEADRYTLIKRLYYDLVGLPPDIKDVDAFVNDSAEGAYERLVDRLLASPHFGERWGRHWLDLAHYADSDGFEKDRARPDAYVYRDWVIDAFNNDMPFDQFTLEQLAGDLLPGSTVRQRIATGFLRQTLTNEEGGVDQEEYRVAACFDRTETVGTVWLALTIGCVRCHTHKYDPLKHNEFYKLFAFFNNAEEINAPLPVAADKLAELEQKLGPVETALAARYAQLAPQELAWEAAEHKRIMALPDLPLVEQPLQIVSATSAAAPQTVFSIEGDRVLVQGGKPPSTAGASAGAGSAETGDSVTPDKDTYTVTVRAASDELTLTGFKLHAVPEARLPGKGSGRAPNGNFVLTGFQAYVDSPDGKSQPIELHRADADFAQAGFSAEQVLTGEPNKSAGWAIADKIDQPHSIQFRTRAPIKVPDGGTIRLVLSQQYGGRHLLGQFRLTALSGDERGIHITNKTIADALEMYPEKRVANVKQTLFNYYVTEVAPDEQTRALRRQIDELHAQYHARMMEVRTIGTPRVPRTTHRFNRGEFLSPLEAVDAGVPAVLAPFRPREAHADRLDLARWLVSPENALTPRVAVNHVWQHLFGQGLVRTPNDFGARGEAPTQPELLDWLASRFRSDMHWSSKALIRTIVTSATYRQSSYSRPELDAQDPRNALLFRQNRFRVESELIRDLNLKAAGLLSSKIGGPSVFPPMPDDIAKLSYANSFTWTNSQGDDHFRRGMYTFFKRTIPYPDLMTFDSPDANVACVQRTVSNTPLQALTLLNNESHIEASQALAKRVLLLPPADPNDVPAAETARLTYAFRSCVARPPGDNELAALARVLQTARAYYTQHEDQAKTMIGAYLPESVKVAEAAAWVAAMRVVLNLDEFVTRE